MHEKDYEYFTTSLSRMCDVALFSIEHLVVRRKIIFLKPKVRIVLHQDKVHVCVFPFSFSLNKFSHCDTIKHLVPSSVSFTLIPTQFMSFFPPTTSISFLFGRALSLLAGSLQPQHPYTNTNIPSPMKKSKHATLAFLTLSPGHLTWCVPLMY